MICTRIQ